jgi:hypothetical protein
MDATITITGNLPGTTPVAKVTRSATAGIAPLEATLAAGKAGNLTTRTDNSNGTLTMGVGHGITNGAILSLFWTAANGVLQMVYNATAANVTSNSVPFTGAVGANNAVLPLANTAVVADIEEEFDIDVDGDKVEMLLAVGSKACGVQFLDAGDTVLDAAARPANEPYLYLKNIMANPLTGNAVDAIRLANGDSVNACAFKLGGLYNADE